MNAIDPPTTLDTLANPSAATPVTCPVEDAPPETPDTPPDDQVKQAEYDRYFGWQRRSDAGKCLKPLTAEGIEGERKRRQKEVSGAVTFQKGREPAVHAAGIMAFGRKVLLGTFPTYGDAALAFNTAVELLPGEFDPADKLDETWLADVSTAEDVRRRVREALEDAGVLADEGVEFGAG